MSLDLFLAYLPRDWVQPINLIQGDANHQTEFTLRGPEPETNQFLARSTVVKSS